MINSLYIAKTGFLEKTQHDPVAGFSGKGWPMKLQLEPVPDSVTIFLSL